MPYDNEYNKKLAREIDYANRKYIAHCSSTGQGTPDYRANVPGISGSGTGGEATFSGAGDCGSGGQGILGFQTGSLLGGPKVKELSHRAISSFSSLGASLTLVRDRSDNSGPLLSGKSGVGLPKPEAASAEPAPAPAPEGPPPEVGAGGDGRPGMKPYKGVPGLFNKSKYSSLNSGPVPASGKYYVAGKYVSVRDLGDFSNTGYGAGSCCESCDCDCDGSEEESDVVVKVGGNLGRSSLEPSSGSGANQKKNSDELNPKLAAIVKKLEKNPIDNLVDKTSHSEFAKDMTKAVKNKSPKELEDIAKKAKAALKNVKAMIPDKDEKKVERAIDDSVGEGGKGGRPPRAPKAPKTPKTSKAPKTPKAPKAPPAGAPPKAAPPAGAPPGGAPPKAAPPGAAPPGAAPPKGPLPRGAPGAPKAPRAPRATRAPKGPKAPKAPPPPPKAPPAAGPPGAAPPGGAPPKAPPAGAPPAAAPSTAAPPKAAAPKAPPKAPPTAAPPKAPPAGAKPPPPGKPGAPAPPPASAAVPGAPSWLKSTSKVLDVAQKALTTIMMGKQAYDMFSKTPVDDFEEEFGDEYGDVGDLSTEELIAMLSGPPNNLSPEEIQDLLKESQGATTVSTGATSGPSASIKVKAKEANSAIKGKEKAPKILEEGEEPCDAPMNAVADFSEGIAKEGLPVRKQDNYFGSGSKVKRGRKKVDASKLQSNPNINEAVPATKGKQTKMEVKAQMQSSTMSGMGVEPIKPARRGRKKVDASKLQSNPNINEAVPATKGIQTKVVPKAQMMASTMSGMGKVKKPNKRAEIVKKIMQEKGLKMIEASKYVKENNLY